MLGEYYLFARDTFLFVILLSYTLGSIPVERLLAGLGRTLPPCQWEIPDIRKNWPTFIGGAIKGSLAVFIARHLIGSPVALTLAGLAVISGYFWPVADRLQRRNGFGVLFGVLTIFSPSAIPYLAVIWLLSYFAFDWPFFSNALTILSLPAILWYTKRFDLYIAFGLIISVIFFYRLLAECPGKRKFRRIAFVLIASSILTVGFFGRYVYRGFGVQLDMVRSGNPDLPYVAITFDDGPDPLYTPAILDILAQHNVKATFFMVGRHVEKYPEIARRIVAEGHDIGNHTHTHRSLVPLSPLRVKEEIIHCEFVIEQVTGKRPHLFRPPRGVYSQVVRDIVKERNYILCLWSISSQDWREISSREVASKILSQVCGGDILLFHDSGNLITAQGGYRHNTVKALPIILAGLEEKGLKPVTMQEFLIIKGLTHVGEDS